MRIQYRGSLIYFKRVRLVDAMTIVLVIDFQCKVRNSGDIINGVTANTANETNLIHCATWCDKPRQNIRR